MTALSAGIGGVTTGILYLRSHPEIANVAASAAPRSDFTPPPRPARNGNFMLEAALGNLRNAFDLFAQAPGGDMGGTREKVGGDIQTAATELVIGINATNAESARQ